MSEPRKSSKQATARRVARERAAERAAQFRERQQRLEELAVEYFVAADQIDRIEERADEEIAAIRVRVERDVVSARAAADDVVQRMLDTDITRAEVAERLGVPVRDIKRTRSADMAGSEVEPVGADEAAEGNNNDNERTVAPTLTEDDDAAHRDDAGSPWTQPRADAATSTAWPVHA
jgi:hypothetical protein